MTPHVDRLEMQKLLERIKMLIQRTHEQIQFRAMTRPNAPATEEQIATLERVFRCTLPPSYRLFLSLHNGWKHWSGDVALLSTEEMLGGEYAERIKKWRSLQAITGEYVVIGFSLFVGEQILISIAPLSYGRVIVWEYEEVENHVDFYQYLRSRELVFTKILAGDVGE